MAKRAKRNSSHQPHGGNDAGRPSIRIVGVLFALLANLILVTLASLLVGSLGWPRTGLLLSAAVAALAAGVLAARYVGSRTGIHAFLGGMLSIPLLGLIALNGDWQAAIYGGAFCALGGILMEKFVRARK